MRNINEMLRQAKEAADLRKKETLRLIGATKEVLSQIAATNCYGEVAVWEKETLHDPLEYRLFCENGKIILKSSCNFSLGEPYEEVQEKWVIAYEPGTYSNRRIPGKNNYGIPEDYHLYMHTYLSWVDSKKPEDIDSDEKISVNLYPGGTAKQVSLKWYVGLPFHLEETDSIPRSWWIRVANVIPRLVEDMKNREDKKLSETRAAADLSGKIAVALKE